MLPNVDRTKSYWIEAAQSDLKSFRSTELLPTETDVVIVGSGYSGATAAYWLHKVGFDQFKFEDHTLILYR